MAAIPDVFLGRNTGTLTITPQDVAAGGTLSDNAAGALSVLAVTTDVRKRSENRTEEISGITSRRENNVIVTTASNYTVSGFLLANDTAVIGTSKNKVNAIVQAFDYVKLIFSRGGLTETFYALIQSYEETFRKGKTEFTLEITMIDPGVNNPAQA